MPNELAASTIVDKDAVLKTLTDGDSYRAQDIMSTVKDHQMFMDQIAIRARAANIPGLVITQDSDEHAHEIRSDKLTISDEGGELTATANHWGDAISSGWAHTKNSIADYFTDSTPVAKGSLEDCWNTKGTSDSCTNRRIDAQIREAEGG